MISLISKEWLDKLFHTMKTEPLETFLGTNTSVIKLRTTNNTELDTRCSNKAIKIPIYNPSSKGIRLKSKTLLGHLEQISVAIPLKINLIQVPEVKENKLDQNYNNNHDK